MGEHDEAIREWIKCRKSALYFIHTYCWLYDATSREWLPFRLWRAQADTLRTFCDHKLVVVLKARQNGLTWLALAFALWLILFHPVATVLLFSRRDDESQEMLARLKGMYTRLPEWCRARAVVTDNEHEFVLSNGSRVIAFPATGGDSYTGTLVIVDEADLLPNFEALMAATKPVVDAGGHMLLISRADKSKPKSGFKRTYLGAKRGLNAWTPVFIPWYARPGRTVAWYEEIKQDILSRTGALDELHEQYPATDLEALAPRTLDKRIPPSHLRACYVESPVLESAGPSLPGLRVYVEPIPFRVYRVGADPAEGNPNSDESSLTVVDERTGEEVANLAGKVEPSVFASYIDAIGQYYNGAPAMVERNNHGHAVLLWLRDNSPLTRLCGLDGREGWLSSSRGKAYMYTYTADAFRERCTILHDLETYEQLLAIEGATLLAPKGERDDRADSYALALVPATDPETGFEVSLIHDYRG